MKTNTVLLIGAGAVAAYLLMPEKTKEDLGLGGGGITFLPSIGNLLGDISLPDGGGSATPFNIDLGGLGDAISGLGEKINGGAVNALGLPDFNGFLKDFNDRMSAYLAGLGGGNKNGGGSETTNDGKDQGGASGGEGDIWVNRMEAAGFATREIGTTALQLGGAAVAYQVMRPALPVAGQVLKTVVGAGKPIAGAGARVIGSLATDAGLALTAPLSSVGTIPLIGGVLAAGLGGYAGGTWLMQHTGLGEFTGSITENIANFFHPVKSTNMISESAQQSFGKYGFTAQQAHDNPSGFIAAVNSARAKVSAAVVSPTAAPAPSINRSSIVRGFGGIPSAAPAPAPASPVVKKNRSEAMQTGSVYINGVWVSM